MTSARVVCMAFFYLGAAVLAPGQEYVISTFAGGAPPPTPVLGVDMAIGLVQSVAADVSNTYFVASDCVFKLDQNGVVTRIAGNARPGYSGDGGPATSAELQLGFGSVSSLPLTVDTGGNVYVADNGNNRIRRISTDGVITTVAGNGTVGFSGDGGPATGAQLSSVFGLAVDIAGNLWIADSVANRIRRVTPGGIISTVAGTGDCGFSGDGGPAVAAQLCAPAGIASDTAGNLFITDTLNNRIRQISSDGTITTVAGSGPSGISYLDLCAPSGDGGPAAAALLCMPSNVAVDQADNLFVADTYAGYSSGFQVVRKISTSGIITTVAGFNCWMLFGEDRPCAPVPGDGATATKTYLDGPLGLAVDNTGSLLIADAMRKRILKASPDGGMVTVAGNGQNTFSGDGGPATSAQLAAPAGVAVDGRGDVFIADYANDRIRKITPDGIITTIAGNGTYGSSGDGGPATAAELVPFSVAPDGAGNLFFFDIPNRTIRKISPDGMIATVITVGSFNEYLALDSAGDLFLACPSNPNNAICELSPHGAIRTVAELAYPFGVAVDSAGNLFVADIGSNSIRKVAPDGTITTVAGNGTKGSSGDGGPATEAQVQPQGVAVDAAGNLFISDFVNNRIRKVSPDGIIRTIAGDGSPGYSGDGRAATHASISGPFSIAVDSAGNVYFTSAGVIRVLRPVLPHRIRATGRDKEEP